MKTLILLLMMTTACFADDNKNLFTIDNTQYINPTQITFSLSGQQDGRLFFKDGKLYFEGNVDQSARIFFDQVIKIYEKECK